MTTDGWLPAKRIKTVDTTVTAADTAKPHTTDKSDTCLVPTGAVVVHRVSSLLNGDGEETAFFLYIPSIVVAWLTVGILRILFLL